MENQKTAWLGHLFAFITIFMWGTTYISTKVLFEAFTPEEIIFYRFVLAYIALVIIHPKNLKRLPWKEEALFFALGLFGVTLYFIFENWALKLTYASNVSLYAATIPLLTALLAHYTTRDEKFSFQFFIGFVMAMSGIFLIIYNGKILELNLLGDVLAILASVVFALYNVLIRKLNPTYSLLFVVRRTFFYGIITMIPFMFTTNTGSFQFNNMNATMISNMLFLAVGASLLGYILWNRAIGILGSIKTSTYIYFMPIVTIVTSVLVLDEKVTWLMVVGGLLIVSGVYVNESKRLKAIITSRTPERKELKRQA